MKPTLIASLRTLLADPDRPDCDALFAVLDNDHASEALACLAPPGSLVQIAAAMAMRWSWCCDGCDRQTDKLVGLITDPRCPSTEWMIRTWRRIPSAVGVLRDQTDTLIAWAQQQSHPVWYADLSTLLGPSNASAQLLVRSPFPSDIGRTLRRWSMATDSTAPTAWQAMIDADLRKTLRQKARPSWDFPAWGWDDAVDAGGVLREIVDDLVAGWSPDHPSIRGRIGWIENHVDLNLPVGPLAVLASIDRSSALAEAVCARLGHNLSSISRIASAVPWSRLHPRIQTIIDSTMRRVSVRTWACAIGQAPIERDTIIDPTILLWRIDPERWDDLDPSLRAALGSRISDLPDHCYGWGDHPDLVGRWSVRNGSVFRFWNPHVLPDDLRAWAYADLLRAQEDRQDAQEMINLLMTLPPDRRARFAQIIDWRLVGRSEPTDQPPWDWTGWSALPAADRQRRLRDRLRALWGNRTTPPAYRVWMARSHLLDTVVIAVRDLLDGRRAPRILAALLAQVLVVRGDTTNVGSPLPFPDDLESALRAQIQRLPLARDAQAYAAWCLWVLARRADVGTNLIALHPDVAVALAPLLNADQQDAVAASLVAQGWDSMTVIHWAAACAPAKESPTSRIQMRIP